MNSIQSSAALIAGSGLLIALMAVPMILRRVRPNSLYGVRTKASFASESDWYRINAIGGRYLALAGMVIVLVGIVGFFLPPDLQHSYLISATVATLSAVMIPCIRLCLLKPCTKPEEKNPNA